MDLDVLAYLKCRHLTLHVKFMFCTNSEPQISSLLLGRCLDASSGLASVMKGALGVKFWLHWATQRPRNSTYTAAYESIYASHVLAVHIVLVDKAGWTLSDLYLHRLSEYETKDRAKGARTLPSYLSCHTILDYYILYRIKNQPFVRKNGVAVPECMTIYLDLFLLRCSPAAMHF